MAGDGSAGDGRSTNDGGIVIDLGQLHGVEVLDPGTGRIRLGPVARRAMRCRLEGSRRAVTPERSGLPRSESIPGPISRSPPPRVPRKGVKGRAVRGLPER